MRGGRLLAESSPQELLDRFQCTSLEEAFLVLSQSQENNQAIANETSEHVVNTDQKNKADDSEDNALCQDRSRGPKVRESRV